MRTRAAASLLAIVAVAGCSQPGGPYPSLAPRAAEDLDPRIPIEEEAPQGIVDASLAARLGTLVAQARAGDATFQDAASTAERLVAAAGSARSESWVAAQQAISVAVAAREPTALALGEIDSIAAGRLAREGWIAPAEQSAIAAAAAQVSSIAADQASRIDRLRARLGVS